MGLIPPLPVPASVEEQMHQVSLAVHLSPTAHWQVARPFVDVHRGPFFVSSLSSA